MLRIWIFRLQRYNLVVFISDMGGIFSSWPILCHVSVWLTYLEEGIFNGEVLLAICNFCSLFFYRHSIVMMCHVVFRCFELTYEKACELKIKVLHCRIDYYGDVYTRKHISWKCFSNSIYLCEISWNIIEENEICSIYLLSNVAFLLPCFHLLLFVCLIRFLLFRQRSIEWQVKASNRCKREADAFSLAHMLCRIYSWCWGRNAVWQLSK